MVTSPTPLQHPTTTTEASDRGYLLFFNHNVFHPQQARSSLGPSQAAVWSGSVAGLGGGYPFRSHLPALGSLAL